MPSSPPADEPGAPTGPADPTPIRFERKELWLFAPGTLFWLLVAIGIGTGNTVAIGAAVVLFVGTIAVWVTYRSRVAAARRAAGG